MLISAHISVDLGSFSFMGDNPFGLACHTDFFFFLHLIEGLVLFCFVKFLLDCVVFLHKFHYLKC